MHHGPSCIAKPSTGALDEDEGAGEGAEAPLVAITPANLAMWGDMFFDKICTLVGCAPTSMCC